MTHLNRRAFSVAQIPISRIDPRLTQWPPLCVCDMRSQPSSTPIDKYSHHASPAVERELQRTVRRRGQPARRVQSPGGDDIIHQQKRAASVVEAAHKGYWLSSYFMWQSQLLRYESFLLDLGAQRLTLPADLSRICKQHAVVRTQHLSL